MKDPDLSASVGSAKPRPCLPPGQLRAWVALGDVARGSVSAAGPAGQGAAAPGPWFVSQDLSAGLRTRSQQDFASLSVSSREKPRGLLVCLGKTEQSRAPAPDAVPLPLSAG